MRRMPLFLTALAITSFLSPKSSEACLPNGEMDNLAVYLVVKNPRMKTLCNYCLDSALLPPTAIQFYNPKTGEITLTKTGPALLKKAITGFGGKDKILGRRFALVAQGRIAFTGTLVSSIMSRSLSSPVINLDHKSMKIAASHPEGMAKDAALPIPVNLSRAVLFQSMEQQLRTTIKAAVNDSKFKDAGFKSIEKLSNSSTDPSTYRLAPFAMTSLKLSSGVYQSLRKLTKKARDPQQQVNAILAMFVVSKGLDNQQKQVLRGQLSSSENQEYLEEAALTLALNHDAKSIALLTKLAKQFKESKKIALALRYLKTDGSKSSPYRFGGF